ncbi:MAG: hypothetical protein A2X48_06595 [Lentisphaerae bacterium GWF2_49_21]|nr:MAG: hypothetical protein A2X48_06595 [Lentisphaerae bacterium GWF2_49_21]
MAREHNHGNKQGLKPLPISISSLWDSSLQRYFFYANMRIVAPGISPGEKAIKINKAPAGWRYKSNPLVSYSKNPPFFLYYKENIIQYTRESLIPNKLWRGG